MKVLTDFLPDMVKGVNLWSCNEVPADVNYASLMPLTNGQLAMAPNPVVNPRASGR